MSITVWKENHKVKPVAKKGYMVTGTRMEQKNHLKKALVSFHVRRLEQLAENFLGFFPFYLLYSTLLHLPTLGFHCVGGC
jgi:hypothetical protein